MHPLRQAPAVSRLPVEVAVQRYGGRASWSQLREHVTRHALRCALAAGTVERLRRGEYAVPAAPEAHRAAAQVGGVVSHVSAADLHRIPLLAPPATAHVTVAPNAAVAVPPLVSLHWRALPAGDVRDGVTTVLRTVLDCAATLPVPDALAIADGALRLGLLTRRQLDDASGRWRGKGAPSVRRAAAAADARAANPFESAVRALALEAGCTGFVPQVQLDVRGKPRVDLADVERRIVLEADSFEWHGSRGALRRDCRRYDELVRAGWAVLRFAWEDVMFDRDWVREVIRDVVQARPTRGEEIRRRRAVRATTTA